MKIKILERCYDIKEKETRLPGDVFEVSKKRGEEFISSSFAIEVKETKKDEKKSGE